MAGSSVHHVSILKFIERNWNLGQVTKRSRDNMPNPIVSPANPYVPDNTPAISDLFDLSASAETTVNKTSWRA
jgi:hypothetical protein